MMNAFKAKCSDATTIRPENSPMFTYLVSGKYRGQTVYFEYLSCAYCNSILPSSGVNCNGDTIRFGSIDKLTSSKILLYCP